MKTWNRCARGLLLLRIAAMTCLSAGAARADFTVSFNNTAGKISIVDNQTGAEVITSDPAVHHIAFTRNAGGTDTTITPAISWQAHGLDPAHTDGLDLTFLFDNSSGSSAARPGPLRIPGIVFGLPSSQLGRVRSRDFFWDGKTFDITTTPPDTGWDMNQQLVYPGTMFAPVCFLHAGNYALGISVQYPIVDPACADSGCDSQYAHRIAMGINLPNPEGGRRAWEVNIPLARRDFAAPDLTSTEGLVPAHQMRQYVVSIRVMPLAPPIVPAPGAPLPENIPPAVAAPQQWLALFEPYREYFQGRYLGVMYTPDLRPVRGCGTAQASQTSPTNPYGFNELPGGGGRPYPDGWGGWHTMLQYFHARAWNRYMLWTPSGVFAPPSLNNFPFQFTSQWAHQVVPGGEPSILRDITDGQGSRLGMWWGNSVFIMTTWPPTPLNPPIQLDPSNVQLRSLAHAEVEGAVSIANVGMVGLDAFSVLPPWEAYGWLRQLQTWYPGVQFIQESQPCDVMSTLSAGYTMATQHTEWASNRLITPRYMAEYLLPGHELWGQIERSELSDEIGHNPTIDDFLAKAHQIANFGYVPVLLEDISLTADDISARWPTGLVPCNLAASRIIRQPANAHGSWGRSITISAVVTNPGSSTLRWQRIAGPNAWANIDDQPGVVAGAHTPALTLIQPGHADATTYRLLIHQDGACGDVATDWVSLSLCASADFNHDGDVANDADIFAFFACIAGNCCPNCDSPDFNGDGGVSDIDIESFFLALSGTPPC